VSEPIKPRYRNAYIVEGNFTGPPLGAVRKHGSVWRIYLFGKRLEDQPREGFASRQDAGVRPLELAGQES
jgi:hypothetical protein